MDSLPSVLTQTGGWVRSWRLGVVRGFQPTLRALDLTEPTRVDGFAGGELVSAAATLQVRRVILPGDPSQVYYVKVYRYPWWRPRRLFTFTYRRSRARTEFESLVFLRRHGLPAVEPVAFGSHRLGPIIRSCFVITKETPRTQTAEVWLPGFFAQPPSDAWRRRRDEAGRSLARVVAAMHGLGFFHHDLKFRNLLVEETEGTCRWTLLDFPKGHHARPGTRRFRHAQAFDLATLDKHAPAWLSRTQRLRWFLAYRGHPRCDVQDRVLLRAVERRRRGLLRKTR